MRRDREHQEQVALLSMVRRYAAQEPALGMLYAIPNGGHRNKVTAARLRDEGVRPGVPDLCLPVACQGCHGLYIELKAAGGSLTQPQKVWLIALRSHGYRAERCVGWVEAWNVICDYLGRPEWRR